MNVPTVPPGVQPVTVSQLTRRVKTALEGEFGSVWVVGEVSNLKKHTSGHWYLTLKDEHSQLRTVVYRGVNLRLVFDVNNGLKVIAYGPLIVYEPRGEYQLQVERLYPEGIGPLELAFKQLKEKLSALGYFERDRKKRLPRFPRRIVLVTSPTGAAVRDMLQILGRRWPAAEVWVCPVPVQGEGACLKIAEAVIRLNRIRDIDVLIVGRGGGSLEDLWAFNEECVAQAIFASRIPVVSAVGHEIDVTIADMVADLRAATPSEAAEKVVPDRGDLHEGLHALSSRMRMLLVGQLKRARQQLDDLARRRCLRLPLERIRDEEQRLDDAADRLRRAVRQRLLAAQQRVEAAAGRLGTLSPLNVLARGYSLTRTADGAVVRNPEQVRPGDRIRTTVEHGQILSRVEEAPAAS
jgi:exodeoxyribonuclease VII large subunit